MSWSGQNLLQLLESLNVPTAFLGVLLTVLLALTLAPFLGGFKVGPIEIPKLPPRSRQTLIVATLLSWIVLLVPVFPTETAEAPCLRTANIQVEDLAPQEATLRAFLRHFERDMEWGHEIPVQIQYDETLENSGLPQHVFTLTRSGGVPKNGCWLLMEIADGLNEALAREDSDLRITIFASCNRVHVAAQGSEPPSGDYLPCS